MGTMEQGREARGSLSLHRRLLEETRHPKGDVQVPQDRRAYLHQLEAQIPSDPRGDGQI